MGTAADNLIYCSKEDPNPFIKGVMPQAGKRTDLANVAEQMRAGKSMEELAKMDQFASTVIRNYKGLIHYSSLLTPDRTAPPKVFWLYGATGTGKTRCAVEFGRTYFPGVERNVWISNGDLKWFDGYDRHRVAIFDDFRSKHVESFAFFLRILDRYPIRTPYKGGFVKFVPEVIFITTPYSPVDCFATRGKHLPEDIKQLARRVSYTVHFTHEKVGVARARLLHKLAVKCGLASGEYIESFYDDVELVGSGN